MYGGIMTVEIRSPRALAASTDTIPAAAPTLQVASVADLPSRFGEFRAVAFTNPVDGKEHLAIVRGEVRGRADVPVRIHSECLTGDVLGSLRCDCRDQLIAALEALGRETMGVLLYLRQEGRGIGLTNKIRAYALQDKGYDTIDANRALGFGDDQRDYRVAADMLRALGVKSVKLITNNPLKLEGLRDNGIKVAGRLPSATTPNRHNIRYLRTKKTRAGHWLNVADAAPDPATPMAPTPVSAGGSGSGGGRAAANG
jgi:GTP cyclohydrolase II